MSTTDERKHKSYGFFGTLDYIEKNYDDAAKKRILGHMSPEAREFADTQKKAVFAPPLYSSQLWQGIVDEHPDREQARQVLYKTGVHLGGFATNTYLRLLLRILTVNMFAKKFPDIWSRDANFGKMEIDGSKIDDGRLTMALSDLGNYPYFIPVAEGWFTFSFECMGLKQVKLQSDWTFDKVDTDQAVFSIAWAK